MAKQTVYQPLALALENNGHRAVTMSHESGSMLCAYEIRDLASSLADTFQQPVRLVPHSLGAIHAAEAIEKDSSDIDAITFIQPAGFGGVYPLHFYRSIELRHWLTLDRYRHGVQIGLESLDYAYKGRRELGRTVVKASTKSVIREVLSLPDSVTKNAVLFESDPLIRYPQVSLGLAQAGVFAALLDVPDATHNAQYEHATEVADLIDELFAEERAA
jgi:pimeloyl-ACP methyl ester carboxylesterase